MFMILFDHVFFYYMLITYMFTLRVYITHMHLLKEQWKIFISLVNTIVNTMSL